MQKKEIYHVGIYLRLSREDSASLQGGMAAGSGPESNSIRSQREICRAFVAKRPDMVIYDSYIDM